MSKTHYVKVYKAKDGWRWHEMTSSDITSESGEAYESLQTAVQAARQHVPDSDMQVDPTEPGPPAAA